MKFDIREFFENLSTKFMLQWNRARMWASLHADQYTCFIISCSVLLRM